MEKIRSSSYPYNSFIFAGVLLISFLFTLLFNIMYPGLGYPNAFLFFFFLAHICYLILLPYLKYVESNIKNGIKLDHEGIYIKDWDNKQCKWNELEIENAKVKYLFFKKLPYLNLKFKNKKTGFILVYNFDSFYLDSLIVLTKKYCPKEHDFYKAVSEYAKKESKHF